MDDRLRSSSKAGSAVGEDLRAKVKYHPCYSEEAHHYFARIHLPVAPGCNVQCAFCNRAYDCINESRPGVTSQLLSPKQALERVLEVAARMPRLTVVGIAGPGEPLANQERVFETFELVRSRAPHLKLCLSTNGLALPEAIPGLLELGVEHVTITINALDPVIAENIYQWITYQGKRYTGQEAARLLLDRQLAGLRRLVENRVLVKVNSVLIPGVNDNHLVEVSRQVKASGALLHNVMPLIPVKGSLYGDRGIKAPAPKELKAIQDLCEGSGGRMMRHCRQCRADAVGLLAEDDSREYARAIFPEEQVPYRLEERARLLRQLEQQLEADQESSSSSPGLPARQEMLVAVASRGDGLVNQHFGHAREFLIYQVQHQEIKLVGVRNVEHYCGGPATCGDDPDVLTSIIRMLNDCEYLLCSRVGPGPRYALEEAGIKTIEAHDRIMDVIDQLSRFGSYPAPNQPASQQGLTCPVISKLPGFRPQVVAVFSPRGDRAVIKDMQGSTLEILEGFFPFPSGEYRVREYCQAKYDIVRVSCEAEP